MSGLLSVFWGRRWHLRYVPCHLLPRNCDKLNYGSASPIITLLLSTGPEKCANKFAGSGWMRSASHNFFANVVILSRMVYRRPQRWAIASSESTSHKGLSMIVAGEAFSIALRIISTDGVA